jgi:hypothetical protein
MVAANAANANANARMVAAPADAVVIKSTKILFRL